MNKNKIEKIVKDAWKMFCKDYDSRVSKYSKSLESEKEAMAEHWICWNEYDLMLQFGRFFYKELNEIGPDIELHLEKNLSKSNFEKYSFASKLLKLKGNLKRAPKVDLIITSEKDQGLFSMCGEVKYLHYSVEGMNRGQKTVEQAIEKDLKTLLKIKELGIAESVVFIVLDDYYCLDENKSEKCKNIESLLQKYNKKTIILSHNSCAAKLR